MKVSPDDMVYENDPNQFVFDVTCVPMFPPVGRYTYMSNEYKFTLDTLTHHSSSFMASITALFPDQTFTNEELRFLVGAMKVHMSLSTHSHATYYSVRDVIPRANLEHCKKIGAFS
jgi:hypothetical protein